MKDNTGTAKGARMHRLTVSTIWCLLCLCLPLSNTAAVYAEGGSAAVNLKSTDTKTPQEIEYGIKAAFIYNFMKFVEWPKEKQQANAERKDDEQRMIIGIVGENPFGQAFEPILNKEVHGRKIQLLEIPGYHAFYLDSRNKSSAFADYRDRYQAMMAACNVLFICESEKSHLREMGLLTADNWILTISDIADFAENGGIIGFIKDTNKIRFEINLDAAHKEHITIRSQLLSLAKKVYTNK